MRIATLFLACLVGGGGCFGDDRRHAGGDDNPDNPDARDRPDARPGDPDADTPLPDAEPPECATGEHCDLDCANGDDDDGDTLVDCADPDCDGFAACEHAGERTCNDGVDNDGDGDEDCADAACGWGCAALGRCPANDDLIVVASADVPLAIPDNGSTTSVLATGLVGVLVDAAVRIDITHTWVGDLDISLVAPAGQRVDLTSDNGTDGDNYLGTVFTDDAGAPITSGTAPFTGEFAPEQPLASLAGVSATGTWRLEVVDDVTADTGTLQEAGLALCVDP